MNYRTLWTTVACLALTGAAYAAEHEGGAKAQEPAPALGQEVPATEHQAEALEEVEARFAELDKDGDGYLSKEEAEASPELAGYWEQNDLEADAKMDRADFAQFEATTETGESDPAAIPSSEHQREAVEEVPPAVESPQGQ